MRYFSLILLVCALSVVSFGQEVKPKVKPKPRPATAVKSAVTKAKPTTKPEAPPSNAKGKSTKLKTEAEPTTKTIAGGDGVKSKQPQKPKPETKTAQAVTPKTESKSKPQTLRKTVKSKTAKTELKAKPKQTTAEQSNPAKVESKDKFWSTEIKSKDKSKPPTTVEPTATTVVEPKAKQKTLTPNPPTRKAALVKPKTEPETVKTKTETVKTKTGKVKTKVETVKAKAETVKPKPETEAVKTKAETVKTKAEAVTVKPKPETETVKPKTEAVAVKPKSVPKTGFQPCAMNDAPAIRNLRLGMSRKEVDKILPTERRVTYLNSSHITAYPDQNAGFENINQVTARFQADKLSVLEINYETDAAQWKNVEEFARNLSENLRLPTNSWDFRLRKWNSAEMKCKGFSLKINSELNELTLENPTSTDNETGEKPFKP